MAIYIGAQKSEGDAIFIGDFIPTQIFINDFMTWPDEGVRYQISNARVSYSTGSYITAKGDNYAHILATIKVYRGSILIETLDNVELSLEKVQDDTHSFSDNDNKIYAPDRTDVTGSTRTAIYYGYYKDKSTKTGNLSVDQQANIETRHETTTLYDISAMGTSKYTSSGWNGPVIGYREFEYYLTYTSTYSSITYHGQDVVSATTISTNQYWAHASGTDLIIDANTTTTTDRTATLTASYGGVSDSVIITQWRSAYYTYDDYRILNFSIVPSTVPWNRIGYSNDAVISGQTQRYDTLHKDGQDIPQGWSNFNDTSNMLTKNYSNFKFASYDGTQRDMDYMAWQYPGSTGYAYARIYASRNNETLDDLTTTVYYLDNQAYFTQSGQEAHITVSAKNISYEAGTYYMTVDANVDWTPSSNQSWAAVSKDGSQIKVVVAAENTGATRSATITATGTGTHSSVSGSNTLTQEEGYYFEPQGDTGVTVSYAQTSFSVPFRSSRGGSPYLLTASSVSLSSNTMSAVLSEIRQVSGDMYIAQFTCQPNTSTTTEHTCTITIIQPRSRGDKSIVFNATQSIKEYITITDTYTTSGVSSTFYIPVSSNVDWTVSSNQSWCTVSNNNNTSVKVVVTENPSSSRQAIITLTGSGITARCTLTQTVAATITITIKSNANTSSFALYSGTGASGQILVSDSISQGQSKAYTVPKDSIVKSWMITASGLTYCNFAGTPGTQIAPGVGVWQNTSTSITLTDGSTYSIN